MRNTLAAIGAAHGPAVNKGMGGSHQCLADAAAEAGAALSAGGALHARCRPEMARQERRGFGSAIILPSFARSDHEASQLCGAYTLPMRNSVEQSRIHTRLRFI